MDAYKIDALHYYTAPGLSWDALLKRTNIDLELPKYQRVPTLNTL